MATMADMENYENMISALSAFRQQVFEASSQMMGAGRECVSGMNGDPGAEKANDRLQKLQRPIQEICNRAAKVAEALHEEMEDIKRAARTADSF